MARWLPSLFVASLCTVVACSFQEQPETRGGDQALQINPERPPYALELPPGVVHMQVGNRSPSTGSRIAPNLYLTHSHFPELDQPEYLDPNVEPLRYVSVTITTPDKTHSYETKIKKAHLLPRLTAEGFLSACKEEVPELKNPLI